MTLPHASLAVPSVVQCSAPHADRPPRLDAGRPDALWELAPRYPLSVPADRARDGSVTPAEGGTAQFLWDDRCLYLAADFVDSDIVARGTADGEMHYQLGDLVELFLWPAASPWYWELYGTPAELQTSLFFHPPAIAKAADANITAQLRLEVSAHVDGTLNDSTDRDRGFRVEMAIPAAELKRHGDAWGPGADWRILVGRYNYGRWLAATELSAMPSLSVTNFHRRKEYARLQLLPPGRG